MRLFASALAASLIAISGSGAAQACDLEGYFDSSAYYADSSQATPEELAAYERAKAQAHELALEQARARFQGRFAIKVDNAREEKPAERTPYVGEPVDTYKLSLKAKR